MNTKQQEWIEKSYLQVAEHGFGSLTVHSISRIVGKSKSSFYHYFGDLELFKQDLLDYHLERAKSFANEISKCEAIDPDFIHVFLKYKMDLFFHKQLRIFRNEAIYHTYIEKAFDLYEAAVMEKWNEHFGLTNQKFFSKKFKRFITEHFLLSITPQDFDVQWLRAYLKEIASLILQMKTV